MLSSTYEQFNRYIQFTCNIGDIEYKLANNKAMQLYCKGFLIFSVKRNFSLLKRNLFKN